MAQHEADREDLLAEATALVERIELTIAGQAEPIVAGFRRDGSLSVFFGTQRVYQFNRTGQLRRAFRCGLLYKAEHHQLFSLRRERSGGQLTLWRAELTAGETAEFLAEASQFLLALREAILTSAVAITGQHSAAGDVLQRVGRWLEDHKQLEIADSPRVA